MKAVLIGNAEPSILTGLKTLLRILAILSLMAAVFLVYWPAQRNGFVWDDTALVLRDPLIRSWKLLPEAFQHFLFLDATASDFYRPLQRLSFMADYALWELTPRGYHLTSIYLHLAAAVALYALGLQLAKFQPGIRAQRCAFFAALLWAIHPLHTSAITYVAGRADPLAALFGFSALALGCLSLESSRYGRLAALGSAVAFLGALLSKESGVFALITWLLILLIRRDKALPRWSLIAVVLLLSYGGLRWNAEKTPPPVPKPSAHAIFRPVLIAQAWAHYGCLFVAPHNLHMERDVVQRPVGGLPRVEPLYTWLGVALAAALAAWAWWSKKHAPATGLCLLGLSAAYLPISNLFALNATVAEHWFYVPSAFLLLGLGFSIEARLRSRMQMILVGALATAWAVFLGLQTFAQQSYWSDQHTFLTRTIAAGGNTARMHINLGNLEAGQNELEAAAGHFAEALRLAPNLAFAFLGQAGLEVVRGNYPAARESLERARAEPFLAPECLQLQVALEFRESGRDGTPLLKQASELSPKNWPLRKRYLLAMAQTGHKLQARKELEAFLHEQSFRAESWRLLGEWLADAKHREAAIAAYEEARQLDVHDLESQQRLLFLKKNIPGPPSLPGN